MKKFLFGLVLSFSLLLPNLSMLARGGDSFAGGMVGGMMGGVISGAMTKDSGSSRRAEEEARRAQEQTAQLRREQQQEKISSIKEDVYQYRNKSTTNILLFALAILFLLVLGLAFMVFNKKRNR